MLVSIKHQVIYVGKTITDNVLSKMGYLSKLLPSIPNSRLVGTYKK